MARPFRPEKAFSEERQVHIFVKWAVNKTMLSCWNIWHKEFKNDTAIPDELKRRIRVRSMKNAWSPGKSPAKRRRVDAEQL
ncbi:hypothetical protein Pcac1_g7507 [Phytophthora cactorum]|uniref:Uncharacterized protein n=1 Tax=Phytophthora cactorum TaxID=29920 RepID=A0A8T0YXT8_9STRA|nr:hypothetical protein Pcac1_g7507 [Phytophthora cactorum]KAG2854537.1 hypothetical protein PC113_g13216 [Phytophthora cactorum]